MITGITFSTFDLLHAGHIAMLREAKSECDYLICGLHIDPQVERPNKNKPIQNVVERYTQLSGVKYVDEIIPYNLEEELIDILLTYPIDVRIIGSDYIGIDFTGKQLCIDNDIKIYYNNRRHGFSSSSLREKISIAEKKS
jgi:glycerol-3-phosphate cytidylyltransferase